MMRRPNEIKLGDKLHFKTWSHLKTEALLLSSLGYGVAVLGFQDMSDNVLTITQMPEEEPNVI